ncbi:MAG: hypothetical protein ACXQTR_04360 [Candidatus Methanospirareceae archaeon]
MAKKPRVKGMSRKQRAATMIAIRKQQAGRSPRAVSMDARRTARKTFDEESDSLPLWQRNPGRYDVQGVDTRIDVELRDNITGEYTEYYLGGWKIPPEQFINTYVASKVGKRRPKESDLDFKLRKMNATHFAVKAHSQVVSNAVDRGEAVPEEVLNKYSFTKRLARPTKTADTAALEKNVELLNQELKSKKAPTEELVGYGVLLKDTRKELRSRKPKPKPPETESVKIITDKMPDGYEIHKWSYVDRTGKQTVHAVIFEGKPVFDQNKTFGSLTDARKAVKEHDNTQRLLEKVRKEREYLEKHRHLGKTGYIGTPLKKTRKTKKSSDVIGERPTGIVRKNLHKLWGQVHGDDQIGDFDTWMSEQSDKTYSEAKSDLLRRGSRRQTEMTPGEQAQHEREQAKHEIEMEEQSCEFHIGGCDRGDINDCRIACEECGDDESCEAENEMEDAKKRKVAIPEGMVAQKSLTGTGGQMRFKSGEGKRKSKKAATKNPKGKVKKGSGKLPTFGVKMPGMPTIEDFGN